MFASSEIAPFAKTGGLADVCGALPLALRRLGHEASAIMPAYRSILRSDFTLEDLGVDVHIPIGSKIVSGRYLRGRLPGGDVPVYFVQQDGYYDRAELYGERGEDYRDNCERFVFFCRAALEAVRLLKLPVEVFHCHDWQTGLIPAYLKLEYAHTHGYEHLASVMTIHNLAYQGQFWHWDMLLTGLDWKYFNWREMEFFGHLNLLKTGLVFADAITTVSPQYALEIQQPPLGCGLEGVLQERADVMRGILNGVSYEDWNPAHDPHLATHYDTANWRIGKRACKAALQQELQLPAQPEVPLIGLIGRLADQKGWNLVAQVMDRWVKHEDAQWAILGRGEPMYHELLQRLAAQWPQKVAVRTVLSEPLAHRIEAGSDLFLMPSLYEPCGLSQMYSLKYGSVPVVRATGGLADTITDANPETLASGTANGFSFANYNAEALEDALRRACHTYRHAPDVWAQLVTTGMQQDWSWGQSARQYAELYAQALAAR